MKIGVLSDMHIDTNAKHLAPGERFAEILNKQIKERKIELFLMAGDISSDYRESEAFLDELELLSGIPVLFVPGNHDFWSKKNGETDTQKIYAIFKDRKDSVLENPYLINDEWAVVGNSGWYDHSYADTEKYTEQSLRKMRLGLGSWQDIRYCHWGAENKAVAQWMLEKIEEDMLKIGDRKVILMTHIVTHPDFIVPLPNKIYDYFNAFLGSSSYEVLYDTYPIHYSIMGHVHFRQTLRENGVQYICACLGNKRSWRTKSVENEIIQALQTFEI